MTHPWAVIWIKDVSKQADTAVLHFTTVNRLHGANMADVWASQHPSWVGASHFPPWGHNLVFYNCFKTVCQLHLPTTSVQQCVSEASERAKESSLHCTRNNRICSDWNKWCNLGFFFIIFIIIITKYKIICITKHTYKPPQPYTPQLSIHHSPYTLSYAVDTDIKNKTKINKQTITKKEATKQILYILLSMHRLIREEILSH